jgi:hypothetical protein
MTTTEAPQMFIHGKGGIAGYRGRVVFQGKTHWVLKHGQWAFDTRAQAAAATKRFAAGLGKFSAEMKAHRDAFWAEFQGA